MMSGPSLVRLTAAVALSTVSLLPAPAAVVLPSPTVADPPPSPGAAPPPVVVPAGVNAGVTFADAAAVLSALTWSLPLPIESRTPAGPLAAA